MEKEINFHNSYVDYKGTKIHFLSVSQCFLQK